MATTHAATNGRQAAEDGPDRKSPDDGARRTLLAALPVTERRFELAGVSTSVLEGGDGSPIVLLHGPGGNATHWLGVIPGLVRTHHVVTPDLPGHGSSQVNGGPLDAERVMGWLAELIERTCQSKPTLVGGTVGGAIAARFAVQHGKRLRALVLVDTLGLTAFRPAPQFGRALTEFLGQPNAQTHDELWRYCAFDIDRVRQRMGERWEPFMTYNVDRATSPSVAAALGALMDHFGVPAISPADLARISVPTTLIWGRHDLATDLRVAEAASERYGWPLEVIEACADDPPVEQPEALLEALHRALDAVMTPARGAAEGR